MNIFLRTILLAMVIPVIGTGCTEEISFNHEVMPVLKSRCSVCHGDDGEGLEQTAFSVNDYDSVMQGTRYGPVIVPGHSEASTLFRVISHQADTKIQMPPHHQEALPVGRGEALSFTQIETIRDWIDQGARNN